MTTEGVHRRLTAWYVGMLAGILVAFGAIVYVLTSNALDARVDDALVTRLDVAGISLSHDADEGQSLEGAAWSTADELGGRRQPLAIFDGNGRMLAHRGWPDNDVPAIPAGAAISPTSPLLTTIDPGGDDSLRLAFRRANIDGGARAYILLAGEPLESTLEELAVLRKMLLYAGAVGLAFAGVSGWLLAKKNLRPVAAAFEQQQRFMADASHELRTPIATARTAASVTLQKSTRDEAEYREALHIVERQTRRLTRIFEDMQTLARVDAGEYPVRREHVRLAELIDEVVDDAQVLAADRHVRVGADRPDGVTLTGDEHLLRRMIVNLVDNAVRHTPPGGSVTISVTPQDDELAIAVADTGRGIPIDAQPHIFERFYRADVARTRDGDPAGSGAGLGLAIASWIAQAHRGRLELLRSTPEGTLMRVTLPAEA